LAGLPWPASGKTTFSLNRMKILKKSLPSQKLSTTLARLDRQNMFEEIR
jgi:tRNA uridine 5-carbamoylmethylation protein Kti12